MARRDQPKAYRRAKKDKGGRPLKLTDELIDKLKTEIEFGNYIETAVAVCGVPKATFYAWLKTAHEKPKSIHGRLLDAVNQAQAFSESRDVKTMLKHSLKNYNATAWRLSRRFPERWAATHRPPVQGAVTPDDNDFRLAYNLEDDEDKES